MPSSTSTCTMKPHRPSLVILLLILASATTCFAEGSGSDAGANDAATPETAPSSPSPTPAPVTPAVTAPAPVPAPISASKNVTGSLGNLCSSQAGLYTALQGAASNQDTAGLALTVPADLAGSLQQVAQIAWEYIVSYPLPLIAKSFAAGSANGTAINSFHLSNDHLANYNDTGGVTPNHDTLYNQAILELSEGPQIITVPEFDTPKRYWIVPFLDAYLNFYGAIGSDFGSTSGRYLVVGPGASPTATYEGFTPDRIFRSPTDLNWVIGRVLVLNDTDLATAYNFSKAYTVSPYDPAVNVSLNASSKSAIISKSVNGSGYGVYKNSVGFLSGFSQQPAEWFSVSATFLSTDPPANTTVATPSTADQITTFTTFSQAGAAGTSNSAFQLGQQVARRCILDQTSTALVTNTGWAFHNTSGIYSTPSGTDYLLRAQDAQFIPAALPPTEVIYFLLATDSTNQPLDASTGANYTITFPLPLPAKAFWSLTMYNASSLLLFQNPINRYDIGDRTAGLVYTGANNDTLEVFISASAPAAGTAQAANWLPAPVDAGFQFILRTYLPPASSIAGQYAPPAVVKVATSPTSTAGK